MKTVRVSEIDWDAPKRIKLPKEIYWETDCDPGDESHIIDEITDEYGFCIFGACVDFLD